MWVLRVVLLGIGIFQVCMAQDPKLEVHPASIAKPRGDTVYATCSADVQHPELVTQMVWSGPNGEPIRNDGNSKITAEAFDGPHELSLLIRDLQDQDSGVYKCTALYDGNQRLSVDFRVDCFMDIDFGDTPTHQPLVIHSDSKIRCNPVAKPNPHVDWLKDNKPIRHDDIYIIQQDGLLVRNVTEEDEGVYRCRARVPELGSLEYRDIQVDVYIPPVIIRKPEDKTSIEGESVIFECEADGKPAANYTWVDKNNQTLENMDDYFVHAENGYLIISNLKLEHAGKYRCTATNPAGSDFAEASLQVLTRPKVEEYLNITNRVDDSVDMRCVASGYPMPSIVFKKDSNNNSFQNGINDDDRIEVKQQVDDHGRRVGILSIRDLQRHDNGLYTCTAESEGGMTQEWGHITVEFAPIFENQPSSDVWSWQNAQVNLTCVATSVPNATITWYLGDEPINASDPNLKVLTLGPNSVLQVDPVDPQYYQQYTCEATNTIGSASRDIEVKEAHLPGPVLDVKLEGNPTKTVTWIISDPTDDGEPPIQGYSVEYRLQNQDWTDAKTVYWPKGSSSYTVYSLEPREAYVFRFSARNVAGNGKWGVEKPVEMPGLPPSEEPLIIGANDDGALVKIPFTGQYKLQWQIPESNARDIDYYRIIHYQVRNNSGKWDLVSPKKTKDQVASKPTFYIIENLDSNSNYKILLHAHRSTGLSTPAEIVIQTGNDPSEAGAQGSGIGPSTSAPANGIIFLFTLCFCCLLSAISTAIMH